MIRARWGHLKRNPMKTSLALVLGSAAVSLLFGCSDGTQDSDSLGGAGTAGLTQAGGSAGTPATGGSASGASAAGTSQGGALAGAGGGGAGGPSTGGTSTGGASTGGTGGGAAGAAGMGGAGGGVPTDGPGLYQAYCFACHGQQGAGGPLAPEVQHPVRDYSSWVVRKGRAMTTFPKPMEPFEMGELSDAQVKLIWDYLDLPPQPTTGQALYLDYCGNCHGADGKGGPTTRPIVDELQGLKDQVRKGAHPGEFDMRREYMPAWTTARITDAELDLIYKYVESL
jgi:mono/diheme cytochrome c family protein